MKKRQRKRKKPEVWTVQMFPPVSLSERVLPLIQGDSILDLFRIGFLKALLGIGGKKCQR